MVVLKYAVLGLLVLNTCGAFNSDYIKEKIQKRKGFLPKSLKALLAPVPLENSSEDPKSSNNEEIQVKVLENNDFSTTMMITAAVILRRALYLFPGNPCEILRGFFQHTYTDCEWQCVDYNMVAVGSRKSINLEVANKKYLLFATNK